MSGFHEKAWLAWTVAACAVALAITNPLATVLAYGAVLATGIALVPREGASTFALLVKLGLGFVALRMVLFGLTGHAGETVLAVLPGVTLPAWLGGFSIGGPVTAEVLAQQAAEGLRLATILACIGVFLGCVPVSRLLRLVPRFLFEAGLVVSIALAFVPSMVRRATEVRDAQRLRGHRFRGLRSMRPLVVPVLADALERSITIAESMEMRGYGRAPARGFDTVTRVMLVAGLLAICVGGGAAVMGSALGSLVALAGIAAVAVGLRRVSDGAARTRFRARGLDRWDRALVASAGATVVAALAARALDGAAWYAYPALTWPALKPWLVLVVPLLALPVSLTLARAASLGGSVEPLAEPAHAGAIR